MSDERARSTDRVQPREEKLHVYQRQAVHRVLPWPLGRRFVFQQSDPALQADGHEVIAVQYGLNSYADDVATVMRTLCRVSGFLA